LKKNRTNNTEPFDQNLLVFRFSAMGDVVLTLPVIRGLLNACPALKITLVTRKNFIPFFSGIERLEIIPADFASIHKGIPGIFRLFFEIKNHTKFNAVIDLHSVLRTHLLCFLFKLKGIKSYRLKKDRRQKKAALKTKGEPNLPHTTERYFKVFQKAGFEFKLAEGCSFSGDIQNSGLADFLGKLNLKNSTFIGIAPFAKHLLKIYPEHHLVELLSRLAEMPVELFLFGGGKSEKETLSQLALKFDNAHVVNLPLSQELLFMQQLKVMLSMDSANMHIASIAGIPVVSVWGATHPGIGFGPLYQLQENVIHIPVSELECRPCTIYGKGTCRRGDFACMERIDPQTIFNRIKEIVEIAE
jgi:ADP-heptose:LPS heptosyltransferase